MYYIGKFSRMGLFDLIDLRFCAVSGFASSVCYIVKVQKKLK